MADQLPPVAAFLAGIAQMCDAAAVKFDIADLGERTRFIDACEIIASTARRVAIQLRNSERGTP